VPLTAFAARARPPVDALRQIAANPGLLRLELGSLAFSAADGMVVIGLAVLAYEEGGTTAVAILAIIRALPSVVLVPYLLARTDTMARDALLRLVVGARIVCLVAITALVVADSSLVLIFFLAAVDSVAGGLLRPLRSTLTPALARSTEELVAANVALSGRVAWRHPRRMPGRPEIRRTLDRGQFAQKRVKRGFRGGRSVRPPL